MSDKPNEAGYSLLVINGEQMAGWWDGEDWLSSEKGWLLAKPGKVIGPLVLRSDVLAEIEAKIPDASFAIADEFAWGGEVARMQNTVSDIIRRQLLGDETKGKEDGTTDGLLHGNGERLVTDDACCGSVDDKATRLTKAEEKFFAQLDETRMDCERLREEIANLKAEVALAQNQRDENCEMIHKMEAELARLKSPPVVRQMPDEEGLWCVERGKPRYIVKRGETFGFDEGVFFIACAPGRWNHVTPPQFPPVVDEACKDIEAEFAHSDMTAVALGQIVRKKITGWTPPNNGGA